MSKGIIWTLILLIVLIGAWFTWGNMDKPETNVTVNQPSSQNTSDTPATSTSSPNTGTSTPTTIPKTVTVTYSDTGFEPKVVNIKVGDTVRFINNSSKNMWVASAMHPSHTVYSGTPLQNHCPDTTGTAFDQCRGETKGVIYSFTFNKAGTWGYHDHIDASKFGQVMVE